MQTIDRTVEILNTISTAPSGLTLTELSNRLGLPKTTAYRMLQALLKHDFLRKDDLTKVYRLGPALLTLAADSLHQWDLRSIARPYLQQLGRASNETVFLTVLHKDTAICLDTIESDRNTAFLIRVGREMEFHCASSAKVILAYQLDDEIARILRQKSLVVYTPNTITDINELIEHLKNVRTQGYAFCDGELEVGVRAIAAPIMQEQCQVIGSVGIVAPAERLDKEARERLLPLLIDTAQQISEQLGCPITSPGVGTTVTSATARK